MAWDAARVIWPNANALRGTRAPMSPAEGKPPAKFLIALTGALTQIIHVSPIGLVQFADFVSDGQKQETSAFLAQLSHRGGFGHRAGEQEVSFAFALLGVEEAHRQARFERFNGTLNMSLHAERSRPHLHEESYGFTLEKRPRQPQKRTANRKGLSCDVPWV